MPATTPDRIETAVLAALATAETAEFDDALAALAALDRAQTGLVLAGMIRRLLELRHPDGLDGADVQDELTGAVHSASWRPDLPPAALAEVLLGALGLLAPEEARWTEHFAAAAVLLILALSPGQPLPVAELLRCELAEIERAETMELP